MNERRQFDRYQVAEHQEISLRVGRLRRQENLISLGLGGCGFFSRKPRSDLMGQERLLLEFECRTVFPEPLVLRGEIIYCSIKRIDQERYFYYGVKFLKADQALLGPIIDFLELEADQGKIALFLR